ncbi:hypothetical protein [Vibrio europaeus]|uniref:DUF2927 domain-containing protein n=1 Tax=Vibrio europaeus TaxID=300876 RepID=A0A178J3A5_9VIBR|nr:hypothetical protein [Vibrio europaeus]MDC5708403.1 hypothetical protein [Vibrio europaeus]MDC5713136.1 hypothetical protein [Vibrio europaeus]MDC5728163.1 hypothetical protein [Vibrio europaeus]MDC5733242.1 hypothetical protein [Vibrio europaeus]MDC5742380.1 hypothetical protein [Vibrio europaeus]
MKRLSMFLMALCLSFPTWAQSPALTELLIELDAQYSKTYTTGMKEDDKRDVTKLAYFLQHIDEQGTPEKEKLDTYLIGLHNGIYDTVNMQRRMNAPTWFCMHDTMIMNPKRHPDFLKSVIWNALEKTVEIDPNGLRQDNYAGAFGVSINQVIKYGLQTQYPCFETIPKSLQLNGWKY